MACGQMSADVTAIPLGRRLPGASSNLPGRRDPDTIPKLARASFAPSLFGLAPGGVCRAAGVAAGAVRSYRTVSPLPRLLRNAPRRSVLCGTFPGLTPAGCYPAPLVHGARTFLPGNLSVSPERPSDRLTRQGMGVPGIPVKSQSKIKLNQDTRPEATRFIAVRARAAIVRVRPRLASNSCNVL